MSCLLIIILKVLMYLFSFLCKDLTFFYQKIQEHNYILAKKMIYL